MSGSPRPAFLDSDSKGTGTLHMVHAILRAAAALLLSTLVLGFSGCSAVGQMLPGGLGDALAGVTSFADGVADWRGSLGDVSGDTQLGQLADYADQAGNLGAQLSGMTEGLESAMADTLGAIGSKLEELSGVDVEGLKGLGPDLKKQAVDGFAESAGSGGTLAQDFLGQFGL